MSTQVSLMNKERFRLSLQNVAVDWQTLIDTASDKTQASLKTSTFTRQKQAANAAIFADCEMH